MLRYSTFSGRIILLFVLLFSLKFSYAGKEEVIRIKTNYGTIHIWLYKDTPKHRENFLKLAKEGFYDSTTFHRVIKSFMIQGGDPNTQPGNPGVAGQGGPGYTLEAEIVDKYYHRRGMLAAAREGDQVNPERRSSGSQFYIVQGKKVDSLQLEKLEPQMANKIPGFSWTSRQKEVYATEGGAPWLDRQYTIFGEVIAGMDVVDKIAEVEVDGRAMPNDTIYMKVEVIKLSKRKLRKEFGFEIPD